MPGGPVGGHPSRSCGSVALLYLGSSASILHRFGDITQVATLRFYNRILAKDSAKDSTAIRLTGISESRLPLQSCRTILGIPEGRLPSRMLGSARRLGKQRTYRRTGSGDQRALHQNTSPFISLRSPLKTW